MDKELIGYLVAAAMLALFVLAWKPLHKRFKAQAIIIFYLMVASAAGMVVIMIFEPRHLKDWWVPVFCLAAGLAWLLSFRREVTSFIPATSYWKIVQGSWRELELEGLPPNQIERLKRMTPEERKRLVLNEIAYQSALNNVKRPRWEPSEHCDIYNGDADEYRCL